MFTRDIVELYLSSTHRPTPFSLLFEATSGISRSVFFCLSFCAAIFHFRNFFLVLHCGPCPSARRSVCLPWCEVSLESSLLLFSFFFAQRPNEVPIQLPRAVRQSEQPFPSKNASQIQLYMFFVFCFIFHHPLDRHFPARRRSRKSRVTD